MKLLAGIVVGLLVIIVLVTIFGPKSPSEEIVVPANGTVVLNGELVCLPHRDSDGPQTLECAYGLRGMDGNYYDLTDTDTSLDTGISEFPTSAEVEVRGMFTANDDSKYDTVGTIEVESITTVEEIDVPQATSTVSDGIIMLTQTEPFGLAVNADQVPDFGVIPPCDEGFLYCLYYNDVEYEATNFISAGVAITQRDDLTSMEECLMTPPSGYTDMEVTSSSTDPTAMSVFTPLLDAGAGSYATGEEFRLYTDDSCYAFRTRVGETQFANTATGTQEFTEQQREELLAQMAEIVGQIQLERTGETIGVPEDIESQ